MKLIWTNVNLLRFDGVVVGHTLLGVLGGSGVVVGLGVDGAGSFDGGFIKYWQHWWYRFWQHDWSLPEELFRLIIRPLRKMVDDPMEFCFLHATKSQKQSSEW